MLASNPCRMGFCLTIFPRSAVHHTKAKEQQQQQQQAATKLAVLVAGWQARQGGKQTKAGTNVWPSGDGAG